MSTFFGCFVGVLSPTFLSVPLSYSSAGRSCATPTKASHLNLSRNFSQPQATDSLALTLSVPIIYIPKSHDALFWTWKFEYFL